MTADAEHGGDLTSDIFHPVRRMSAGDADPGINSNYGLDGIHQTFPVIVVKSNNGKLAPPC